MDIVSISPGGVSTQAAALGIDSMARTLSIGSTWTKLRFGFRWAFDSDPAANITTTKIFFGLCSGTTQPYNSSVTTAQHLVGFDYLSATMTRTAGLLYLSPTTFNSSKTQNGTRTPYAGITGRTSWAASASGNMAIAVFEIDKTATTYKVGAIIHAPGTQAIPTNKTTAELEDALRQPLLADVLTTLGTGYATATDTTNFTAYDTAESTYGALNTINIGWNKSTTKLVIDDLTVSKLI